MDALIKRGAEIYGTIPNTDTALFMDYAIAISHTFTFGIERFSGTTKCVEDALSTTFSSVVFDSLS